MYGYPLEDDSPVLLLHFLVAVLNHPTISKHVLELMTLPAQAIEPLESRKLLAVLACDVPILLCVGFLQLFCPFGTT